MCDVLHKNNETVMQKNICFCICLELIVFGFEILDFKDGIQNADRSL